MDKLELPTTKGEIVEITEVAERTESILNDTISEGFEMRSAQLYGVSSGDEPEVTLLTQHPDVYELLESKSASAIAGKYDYFSVVTTGWAAPLNNDGEVEGAPSAHPQRRRVRLCVVASRDEVASVLRFSDVPDEVIIDAGSATGSLADAIQSFVKTF